MAFELYCGDDALTLPLLAVGGVGIVSVAAHWAGTAAGRDGRGLLVGRPGPGAEVNSRLFESYQFESSEAFPNPMPAKAACRALGLPAGQCRLPNAAAPVSLDDQARYVVERVGRASSGAPVRDSIG